MNHDQWEYWSSYLAGTKRDDLIQKGNPQSGFFRDRSSRCVAIWRDEVGTLQCAVTSGFAPRHPDEVDELFSWVCNSPITRELFMHIRDGGDWPETVPEPEPERGIGDNNPPEDLTPDKALSAEISALETQCRKWLESLPNKKPSTKVEADLAANYADKFLAFEKRAIELHKAEKEPHLKAGRECDARWFAPVRDVAKSLKEKINAIALAWARAEDLRKAEEARKANEELRRIADEEAKRLRDEADYGGLGPVTLPPVAVVEVVPEKTKVGTSRARSAKDPKPVYVITDLPAFSAHLAAFENPPPEFMEACRTIANRLGAAGANPPGVEKRATEFVL